MSAILTTPATLTLAPRMASLLGVQSVTFQADSRSDKASNGKHGLFRRLSRDNALRAVIACALAHPQGRQMVESASRGNGTACAILASSVPGVWRDPSGVAGFYSEHPTGADDLSDRESRPDPVRLCLAALEGEAKAIAKAEADKAKAEAKPAPAPVEPPPVHTCALPPVEAKPPRKAKASKGKAKA